MSRTGGRKGRKRGRGEREGGRDVRAGIRGGNEMELEKSRVRRTSVLTADNFLVMEGVGRSRAA